MNSRFKEVATRILNNKAALKKDFEGVHLLIVHHLLGTHFSFFEELISLFEEVTFIAIPYSVNFDVVCKLREKGSHVIQPKSIVDLENQLQNRIEIITNNNQRFVIIEVGGYSCKYLERTISENNSLIAVIEDTENGHRIYEKYYKQSFPAWKTYSVARSPLKISEDILTGDSIAYSVEKIIRDYETTLVAKKVLVIGYGKIGKGVCSALKGRKCDVYVYDIDPIRTIEAISNGFNVGEKGRLIQQADIIIGVTGYTSLGVNDFQFIKNGAFLFSGSSKQVEFDLNYIKSNYIQSETCFNNVNKISFKREHSFYLANNGEPVNFIDKGIAGSFLELVWLEILKIITIINNYSNNGFYELSDKDRQDIASFWLEMYSYDL
jgi:adenosylhomocysteinase